MSEETHNRNQEDEKQGLPFVAPCKILELNAPVRWIKLGFKDFKQAPRQSLTYGAAMVLIVYLVGAIAYFVDELFGVLGLISGFIFLGPILAIGLYSISRQIQLGRVPVLGYCLREGRRHMSDAGVYGIVLLVVFLLWARATSVIHIFFPENSEPEWDELMLFTSVMIGVGTIFASIIFCASAFSLPMIMDRKADTITAIVTSVHAVLRNKLVMIWWALIIVFFIGISILTAFLGLIVLMPLVGHATWHAYQETIDSSQWPKHED